MKLLKTSLILLVIILVFGAAMFGLNFHTGPLIEKNNAGAELAPLLAVMPEGSSFGGDALIYDAAAPSDLTGIGEQVLKIYKEAAGNGYAIQCKTVGNYEATPMTLTIGVTADGKICGLQVDTYTDSIDVREKDPNFLSSFVGKDSALADVNLVAGCTFSSKSIKEAVSAGLEALIANNLIAEGVKSPTQILTELIPTVHPGMTSGGALKATEITPAGNIASGYKADNGSGFAYIMTEGEESFLAVVNAMGVCRVYNVEGADVTADKAALADEAKAHAAANQTAYAEAAEAKIAKLYADATDITALELNTFNTVVYAAEFKVGEAAYYAFCSRSIGFDGNIMDVYLVIDANGAIAKLDTATLFYHTDYFQVDDNFDVPGYLNGFAGLTPDTFQDENVMISGATITSNAIKVATNDAFAAFESLQTAGGEQ